MKISLLPIKKLKNKEDNRLEISTQIEVLETNLEKKNLQYWSVSVLYQTNKNNSMLFCQNYKNKESQKDG